MELTLDPTPTVDVGPDAEVCEGSDYTINSVNATNASAYSWTINGGDGDLINPNSINPVYSPGPNDIANGATITLTLVVTSNNSCAATVEDSFDLTVVKQPIVDAGPDQLAICEDGIQIDSAGATTNYQSVLWTSSGSNGTLNNPTSLTPTYIPSAADINAGTVTLTLEAFPNGPCAGNFTDSIIINIDKAPIVEAGNNGTICAGEDFTVTGADIENSNNAYAWSSAGGGLFFNDDTLTPTYSPSSAEKIAGEAVIRLTVQADGACSDEVFDELTISITPLQ